MWVTSPAPRDSWAEVLAADPGAMHSQTPTWLDCACAAEGWKDASRLYELPGGRMIVLPAARRPLIGGVGRSGQMTVEASLPHGYGCGGILASGGATPADVHAVTADLAHRQALRTMVRPGFHSAAAWAHAWKADRARAVTVSRTVHVLDLDGGLDAVWRKRFTSKARTGIRNAERKTRAAGVEIEVGNSPALVAAFYDVYVRWLDRRARERMMPTGVARWRGRRAEPLRRFQTAAHGMGDSCRIWVARLDDRPIAANIALFHGAVGVGWRCYGDRPYAGPLRTVELLEFLSIQHACDLGCRYFEMGESGGMAGIEHLKQRLGARRVHFAEYAFERMPLSRLEGGFEHARARTEARVLSLRTRTHGTR